MGMYDNLQYEGIEYQTKEFECSLDNLRIVNGRLLRDDWHYAEVPKEKRPYPNADGMLGFAGSMKRVIDKVDIDMDYHGVFEAHYIDKKDKFRSVLFKFTEGNLVEVIKQDE